MSEAANATLGAIASILDAQNRSGHQDRVPDGRGPFHFHQLRYPELTHVSAPHQVAKPAAKFLSADKETAIDGLVCCSNRFRLIAPIQ